MRSELDDESGALLCMWGNRPSIDLQDDRYIEVYVIRLGDESVADFIGRLLQPPSSVSYVEEQVAGRDAFVWHPGNNTCNVLFTAEATQVFLVTSDTLVGNSDEICRRARLHAEVVSANLPP